MALWKNHPLLIKNDPLVLAPMAELTHRGYRELLHELGGCDLYFTEMISASAYASKGRFEAYYDDPLPEPEKTVAQLVGSDRNFLTTSAKILVDKGFRGIDLNCGCSAPDILKKDAGAALLSNKTQLYQLVGALRAVLPDEVSLSCKIRLGDKVDLPDLKKMVLELQSLGLDFITLHPKTTKQKPSRPPLWNILGEIKDTLSIPLIANGGVTDLGRWKRLKEITHVGPWMIGRGAIEKPWIFQQIRFPDADRPINLLQIFLKQMDYIERFQPPEFHVSRAVRFSLYYHKNLAFGHRLHYKQVFNSESIEEIRDHYRAYFSRNEDAKLIKI